MKTKNLIKNFVVNVFAIVGVLIASPSLGATDNEVLLDQEGNNLILTILQACSGN
jgi:hypothetical protein